MFGDGTLFEKLVRDGDAIEANENKNVDEDEKGLSSETPYDTHGQELKVGDEVEVVGAAPEAEKGGVWIIIEIEDSAGGWNVWVHKKGDIEDTDNFWARRLELVESNEDENKNVAVDEKARTKEGIEQEIKDIKKKMETLEPTDSDFDDRVEGYDRKVDKLEKELGDLAEMDESKLNEGEFSWLTGDTKQPIYSTEGHQETVWMLDDKGGKWQEDEYEGYGVFGGKDFYILLGEMNGLKMSGAQTRDDEGDYDEDRDMAISLAFEGSTSGENTPGVKYPRFTTDENIPYEKLPNPESHENQGWYQEEENDAWDFDKDDEFESKEFVAKKEALDEKQEPFTKEEIQHTIDELQDEITNAGPGGGPAVVKWEVEIERLEKELEDALPDRAFDGAYENKNGENIMADAVSNDPGFEKLVESFREEGAIPDVKVEEELSSEDYQAMEDAGPEPKEDDERRSVDAIIMRIKEWVGEEVSDEAIRAIIWALPREPELLDLISRLDVAPEDADNVEEKR